MLANKTVGAKFTFAGALVLVLTMTVGVIAERAISSLSDSVDLIVHDPLPGIDRISEIYGLTLEYRGDLWRHIATTDKNTQATLEQRLAATQPRIDTAIKKYEETITRSEDRTEFEKSKRLIADYMRMAETALQVSREGRAAEAGDVYAKQAAAPYDAMKANLLRMIELNRQLGEQDGNAATATASKARATLWILLLVCVAAGGAFLFVILRSLNRDLHTAARKLSGGAVRLADSAAQITSSSQTLAQGASEQAASLEETSASMEEINSMAKRNADNSRSAADLVNSSVDRFGDANRLLERMEEAMGEIHASSGKISKIIKTIDEIAFQTNILALNAAVEAARAGEAGMGFAVVADEVRNLAQRSAQAARDTASLIEESIDKSNGGKAMVEQVAEAIRSITGEISKVKTLVDEVSLGSQEQTTGIEQISRAIGEMERVTQRSAAGAEQSASAATELKSETVSLKAVVEDLESMVGVDHNAAANTATAVAQPSWTAPTARAASTPSAQSRKSELSPSSPEVHAPVKTPSAKASARRQAVAEFPLDDSEFEQM